MPPHALAVLLALAALPEPGRDLYGDPLPPGAIARLGTVRFQHGGPVNQVAHTPDGRCLVTLGWDHTLRVWDAASGRELRAIRGNERFYGCFAVSPDGSTLATGESPGRVRLWDLATGRELRRLPEEKCDFWGLAFAPDGRSIASWDAHAAAVLLWDTAGDRPPRRIVSPGRGVAGVSFSPDGRLLAAAVRDVNARANRAPGDPAPDGAVVFWEAATGRQARRVDLPGDWPSCIAFAPGGRLVAVGMEDGPTRLIDPANGAERVLPGTREERVMCLAFSPDGSTLATGTGNESCGGRGPNGGAVPPGRIFLWDVASGRELRHIPAHHQAVNDLSFAPDGKYLASVGEEPFVRLWGPVTGSELTPGGGHRNSIRALAVSPADGSVFTGSADGTVRRWGPATGRELSRTRRVPEIITGLAVAPDGRSVVAAGDDGSARLWDLAGTERFRAQVNDAGTYGVAYSPGGRTVLVGWLLFDAATGARRLALREKDGGEMTGSLTLCRAWFTPDGNGILLGRPGGIGQWDAATGRWQRVVVSPSHQTFAWAQSPDGRLIATGSELWLHDNQGTQKDRAIVLWETATGQEVARLPGREPCVFALAFSPDGRTLASVAGSISEPGDTNVRLWDVASGRALRRLAGHKAQVTAVAFAPDGRSLISASEDSTALVWGLADLDRLRPPPPAPPADGFGAWWDDLAGDAARAHRAAWGLAGVGDPAVRYLAGKLRRIDSPGPQRLDALVAALDSDRYADRAKATAELERFGPLAEPALRRALAGRPSIELRRRAEGLLAKAQAWATAPETLREFRAVAALERAGTAEARALLAELAGGDPDAALTRDARGALGRIGR
jgi:WD40 repeat protein